MLRQVANIPQRRTIAPRVQPAAVSAWLNPRRRMYAERLIEFIAWHGRKLTFDDRGYALATDETKLHRVDIDRAIDDLYAIGGVDMRMNGQTQTIVLLVDAIDQCFAPRRTA